MSTKKQVAANRQNAQMATGPRTPQGKAKSSLNGLVHGMRSRQVVVPGLGETQEDYDRHVNGYLDYYRPADPIERDLLIGIATEAHRLQRLNIIEAATLEVSADNHSRENPNNPFRPGEALASECFARPMREEPLTLKTLLQYRSRTQSAFFRGIRAFADLRRRPLPGNENENCTTEPNFQQPPVESTSSEALTEPRPPGSGNRGQLVPGTSVTESGPRVWPLPAPPVAPPVSTMLPPLPPNSDMMSKDGEGGLA